MLADTGMRTGYRQVTVIKGVCLNLLGLLHQKNAKIHGLKGQKLISSQLWRPEGKGKMPVSLVSPRGSVLSLLPAPAEGVSLRHFFLHSVLLICQTKTTTITSCDSLPIRTQAILN